MKTNATHHSYWRRILPAVVILLSGPLAHAQIPINDLCTGATVLSSSTSCVNTAGTLLKATATVGAPAGCGNTGSADVWYSFTAQTAYPTITLSSVGASLAAAAPRIQMFTNSCGPWTQVCCASGTTLSVKTVLGGSGLTVGTVYLIRIYTNTSTGTPISGTWGFNICITDNTPGRFDYSKSYVNITKQSTGGTVNTGDVLEFRATMAVFVAADSLSFEDTVYKNGGLILNNGAGGDSICTRTNEGVVYKYFTDAADADAGYRAQTAAGDTIVRINLGNGASSSAKGKLFNTSKPSFYNSTCIIMSTYRVKVSAAYNTTVRWGGGKITYRDTTTGTLTTLVFPADSFYVYSSPGLCPNAISPNIIGVEGNGTFDSSTGSAPLTRNRAASAYTPSYTYAYFQSSNPQGPNDYYYGITNNTSTAYTTSQTAYSKPDGSSPQHRLFGLWDIIGDHTNASNTTRGNPPCDTTKPRSAVNPCGYMLVINSSYKTDTAFQYTVSGLCPGTYYQISAWVRNICKYCSCDSLGNGAFSASYLHYTGSDSSGVHPNITFKINTVDYYNTGDLYYYGGGSSTGSDTLNRWVQKGFTYLTGNSQSSFTLTMRNNAPGGGGNDWALDDIGISTCYPNLKYAPSTNPLICYLNPYTIYDTVSSYFNNYIYYKWQISQNGGATWTDIAGASGTGSPVWNGSAWVYVVSYTIPPTMTWSTNNGDKYRIVVATTAANLASASCQFTDTGVITITTWNCPWALNIDLLNFSGFRENNHNVLTWLVSREYEPLQYFIEKSDDGIHFSAIGVVAGYNNNSVTNQYRFTDLSPADKPYWYRIAVVNAAGGRKYSGIILLSGTTNEFSFVSVVNPFKQTLNFEIASATKEMITVTLIDLSGKVLLNKSLIVNDGVNAFELPVPAYLPSGNFILNISNSERSLKKNVMKL